MEITIKSLMGNFLAVVNKILVIFGLEEYTPDAKITEDLGRWWDKLTK